MGGWAGAEHAGREGGVGREVVWERKKVVLMRGGGGMQCGGGGGAVGSVVGVYFRLPATREVGVDGGGGAGGEGGEGGGGGEVLTIWTHVRFLTRVGGKEVQEGGGGRERSGACRGATVTVVRFSTGRAVSCRAGGGPAVRA